MYALIPAPADPSQWQRWRDHLHQWRESTRALLNFDPSLYEAPEFAWIAKTFNLGFLMLCDQLFFDEEYQLESFLEHGKREFGGYDALIFWHAYPRIGFDDRNQFDFYREMPGGLPRLRQLVDECHARGVRVYIDYNPWDTGTRRVDMSDIDALVELVREIDADAIFLDTMSSAAAGLRERLDAVRPESPLKAKRSCRWNGWIHSRRRGRRASPMCRACCATNGSSGGICSTASAAGSTITPRNCTPPG